jgi:glucokinase
VGSSALTGRAPSLLADVGGTHARFVLHENGQLRDAQTITCASHASLEAAITQYLQQHSIAQVKQAAIAVAGPVLDGEVTLTNLGWKVTTAHLAQACGMPSTSDVSLINDFQALALALDRLPAHELRHLGGSQHMQQGNLAVIGPGTGLGAAGLLRQGKHSRAIVGEGGHMSASAANEREWRILQYYFSQSLNHVSWERLLSGTGLPGLHAAVCAVDGYQVQTLTPEQIGTLAKEGADESCVATIDTFSALLGAFAGDVALVMGATGGVFLAGGIIPKLGKAFSVAKFRARFMAKGRFEPYLAPIGLYLIESAYPAFAGLSSLLAENTPA